METAPTTPVPTTGPPAAPAPTAWEVRCRVFRGSAWRAVLATTCLATMALTSALGVGVPPPLAGVVFLGVLGACLALSAGEARYTLDAAALTRSWRPFAADMPLLRRLGARRAERRRVPFDAIRSFVHDRELSRSFREVEYLAIEVETPRACFLVTDRQDPEGFAAFRAAFLARTAPSPQLPAGLPEAAPAAAPPPIPRRPGFYDRPIAHVLTAVALAVTLAAMLLAAGGVLDAGHVFRLAFVIVPGTLYMIWRTWLRRL